MREMSASEASRNFSAVLDAVEHGETIVVTRSGRRVASIVAAPAESGTALAEVFAAAGVAGAGCGFRRPRRGGAFVGLAARGQ